VRRFIEASNNTGAWREKKRSGGGGEEKKRANFISYLLLVIFQTETLLENRGRGKKKRRGENALVLEKGDHTPDEQGVV